MTGLFHNLVFLCCCFLSAAESEKVLPPENVTLSWRDGLYQQLSWTPPKHSVQGCKYHITSTVRRAGKEFPGNYTATESPWSVTSRVMQGGFLRLLIQTVCGDRRSEAVHFSVNDPDFRLSCVTVSSTVARCSWKPPASAQLSLFYNVGGSNKSNKLRECLTYNSARTSCDLQMQYNESINLLLNGTLGNRTVRNVHHFPAYGLEVRLPPLLWSVVASKEQFVIRWTAPELHVYWTYIVKYTACNKTSFQETHNLSAVVDRDAKCPYRISVRGMVGDSETEGTEWTPDKHYDPVSESNPLLFAVVLLPLVLAVLMVLTLLWCKKNKNKIFPKVPRPNSELFTDLVNNNNTINMSSSYFPKVEEECQVTLVIEQKQPPL